MLLSLFTLINTYDWMIFDSLIVSRLNKLFVAMFRI